MGQYHIVVNLDKREWINPHELACGLKLREQLGVSWGTGPALLVLLAVSNGRGGGDLDDAEIIGRWAGDRIAVVGDYTEKGDLPDEFDPDTLYRRAEDEWTNITPAVRDVLAHELGVVYYGDGWMDVKRDPKVNWSIIPRDDKPARIMSPDIVFAVTSPAKDRPAKPKS